MFPVIPKTEDGWPSLTFERSPNYSKSARKVDPGLDETEPVMDSSMFRTEYQIFDKNLRTSRTIMQQAMGTPKEKKEKTASLDVKNELNYSRKLLRIQRQTKLEQRRLFNEDMTTTLYRKFSPEQKFEKLAMMQTLQFKNTKLKPTKPVDISRIFDRHGVSLAERDRLAEQSFNKIKKRYLAQQGPDKYKTAKEKSFVDLNISQVTDNTNDWANKSKMAEEMKTRLISAKRRKSIKDEEDHKLRILQHFKWSLIKQVRTE